MVDCIRIKPDTNIGEIRLDRFLKERANLTHAAICKFLKEKRILVNGVPYKNCGKRIGSGDYVELFDISVVERSNSDPSTLSDAIIEQKMEILRKAIIFKNDKILVINKPFGMPSQSGSKVVLSLDFLVSRMFPGARIVHRLDKDTSGIMVFARNREVAQIMSNSFKDRSVRKVYLACLSGIPKNEDGLIETYIKKNPKDKHSYMISADQGKIATTHYRVIKVDEGRNVALVELIPKTGRTHQLRVHCSQVLKTPIVGDSRYGVKGNVGLNLFASSILLPKNVHPVEIKILTTPKHFILRD